MLLWTCLYALEKFSENSVVSFKSGVLSLEVGYLESNFKKNRDFSSSVFSFDSCLMLFMLEIVGSC